MGWDYTLDFDGNAALAAEALIAKVYANDPEELHPTISRYEGGDPECATLPNGDMVFVLNYHYAPREPYRGNVVYLDNAFKE